MTPTKPTASSVSEEMQLREKLAGLEREYRAKAEPYVAALCKIEERKPMPPFILEAALSAKPAQMGWGRTRRARSFWLMAKIA